MSSEKIIYLDYAAATPVSAAVQAAMEPYLADDFYNPSSPYAPAVLVRRQLEDAKWRIARSFGGKPSETIITAGATESIALAMTAAKGGRVITSAIEHAAVLENARLYDVDIVAPGPDGIVSVESIKSAITEATQLVTIGLANSEIGTVQPIRQIAEVVIAERARRLAAGETRPIWLHSDASQGFGQIDCQISRLGVDMLTLNAGKVYGPKQVGLLWRRPEVHLQPLIYGGGQGSGLRSGTENVAGTVGFARALEDAAKRRQRVSTHLRELRDQLQARLVTAFEDAIITGSQKRRLPGHLHISFDGVDAERLIFLLESKGVLVATGSACAANSGVRSHVLTALGLKNSVADGSLRLTLGHQTTAHDIEYAADAIIDAVTLERQRVRA